MRLAGGFLRVSGDWDDGWTATVDGHKAPVLRADAIFRGVVVGPGRHRVEFSYRNPAEHPGRLVAGFALFAVVGLAVAGRRRRHSVRARSRHSVRARSRHSVRARSRPVLHEGAQG